MTDFQAVKASVDILAVASQYVELQKSTRAEYVGPCPFCKSGTDRFHVHTDDRPRFWCRQCHMKGDVLDLVANLQGVTVREAAAMLGNLATLVDTGSVLKRAVTKHQRRTASPDTPEWQSTALAEVKRGERLLPGSLGMTYLNNRGITLDTAQAFRLGCTCRHWKRDKKSNKWIERNAIVIPWIDANGHIASVRYRFLDERGHDARFAHLSGSDSLLFGLNNLKGPALSSMLMIVEGELNALSLWQVLSVHGVDVLSIGSKSNGAGLAKAAIIAQGYEIIIVWMDDLRDSLAAQKILPRSFPLMSQVMPEGKKMDANDFLRVGGASKLGGMVAGALDILLKRHLDQIPGGVQSVRVNAHPSPLWQQDGYDPFLEGRSGASSPEQLLARLRLLGAIVALNSAGRLVVRGDLPGYMRDAVRENCRALEELLVAEECQLLCGEKLQRAVEQVFAGAIVQPSRLSA